MSVAVETNVARFPAESVHEVTKRGSPGIEIGWYVIGEDVVSALTSPEGAAMKRPVAGWEVTERMPSPAKRSVISKWVVRDPSRLIPMSARGMSCDAEELIFWVPMAARNPVMKSCEPSGLDWRWPDDFAEPLSVSALGESSGNVTDRPVAMPL